MEENWNDRTKLLIGEEAIKKLENSKVAVYGIGGVGSFAVEALARAGVGHLVLVDNDIISISNVNRQIHATTKTVGQKKVEVMKQRILDINPNATVETYIPEKNEKSEVDIIDDSFDYVIDCVDTVKTKLNLVEKSNNVNVPIISCMGTGNKLNPTMLEVSDIYKTSVCPLAKVMRRELKKRNIKKLKIVYSKEEPKQINNMNILEKEDEKINNKAIGSISFVPSVAGLIIAGEVIKDIIK